jgi:hypothetical protein
VNDAAPGAVPFFRTALRSSLPLWLWAVHFAFSYVAVAIGCRLGWQQAPDGAWSRLDTILALGSALAAGAALWLLCRACRPAASGSPGLSKRVRGLASLLALLAIVWTTVPMLVLPVCRWA